MTQKPGDFAYRHTARNIDGTMKLYWFVTEINDRHELAPWFECHTTAAEIAAKATRGDAFVNKIPAVPCGTPVPRPDNHVWVPTLKHPVHPTHGTHFKKR